MKENIETKDVQRTEYLDKNGLDMLWAKVKENTHNQVEVERNRAVAKENSIIDTKADKSALDDYALNTALTALEQKVTANTAAISDKQDAGNYLHYETLNNEGYYEIPSVCISESDAKLKAILSPHGFQIVKGDLEGDGKTGVAITSNNGDPYIALTDNADRNTLKITREGISNTDNNANHVYATDGSIADLTQYAKKSEIPEVDASNFVGKTATDAQIIKSELTVKDNLRVAHDNTNEWFTNINYDGISVVGNDGHDVYINQNDCIKVSAQIDPYWIYSKMDLNEMYLHGNTNSLRIGLDSIKARRYREHSSDQSDTLFILSEQGVSLYNGDNNHVLTSGGSTIDITQYVLKSVYDEKIAALEARIVALEDKHAEAD